MGRVIHFEIPVSDSNRAAAFYQKVFGWKFLKWDGPMEYLMVTRVGTEPRN
jgi:predicted enzyme related to lactoylglutathione lyase